MRRVAQTLKEEMTMACVWWLGRVLNFCVLGSLLSLSCFGERTQDSA